MANETRSDRPMRERRRRKVCQFCVDKVEHIDYKDTAKLRKYMSDRAKILPRRMTGLRHASAPADRGHQAGPPLGSAALHFRLIPNGALPSADFRRGLLFCFWQETALFPQHMHL